MRRKFAWLALAPAVLLAGCNVLAYPLYLIAPRAPQKTKKAEFAGLADKTVAVLVYADMDTHYEYPYCREELATAVGKELTDHVEDIRMVSPRKVMRYQDGVVHWDTMPLPTVGQALGADYVLYLSLAEYSTHERGSTNLPLGRISGSAAVYDAHAEPYSAEACVWRSNNLAVRVQADTGLLSRNPAALRVMMQLQYAQKLAKHFYDHKVPREE